jgi:hypothetical protein
VQRNAVITEVEDFSKTLIYLKINKIIGLFRHLKSDRKNLKKFLE